MCRQNNKVSIFVAISGTDKTDNLSCEISYDDFTREIITFQSITKFMKIVRHLHKNRRIHAGYFKIPDLFRESNAG